MSAHTRTHRAPAFGSVITHLEAMSVGARWYLEGKKPNDYVFIRRAINANLTPRRRRAFMAEWVFTIQIFTAVSHTEVGTVRHLVCVERTK